MSDPGELIRASEAAPLFGLALITFRRRFCDSQAPRLPIIELRGPRGGRRVFVRRADVDALIETMTVRPPAVRQEPGARSLVQKPNEAPR